MSPSRHNAKSLVMAGGAERFLVLTRAKVRAKRKEATVAVAMTQSLKKDSAADRERLMLSTACVSGFLVLCLIGISAS